MTSNSRTVRNFIDAVNRNDHDRIVTFFAKDICYHNIPMKPVEGPEATWKAMSPIHALSSEIDWQLHAIAENEAGQVLTERSDRYLINGTWVVFKVMGIFELRDGQITSWRDYFDLEQGAQQLKRATGQA